MVNGRDTAFATRADAIAAVQNPAPLDTYTKAGNLEAGANPEYVALVVYMPETVAVSYTHLDVYKRQVGQ